MKRTNRLMNKLISISITILLVAGAPVFGQGSAALAGTVSDPSGAVMSGAKVTATNVATNTSYTTETTDAGLYRFPTLPVGTYKVAVEATGFKAAQIENVILTVGQTATQDIKLDVGTPSEVVTIQGGGEQLVQTTESSVSSLLNEKVWKTYPLENRDTNEFINLLPGAVAPNFAGSNRGPAVNGNRTGTGNFIVDGHDNNEQGQGGRGSTVPGGATSISPEAIQEYRVITNSYAAQYGKGGGFVADTVLKSGTNEYHGSLFEYNRVQALAANDFFSNQAGVKDSLVRNQFGGSFGGPVIKEKTFLFGTVEFHRLRQGFPVSATGTTQEFIDFVDSGRFARFHETDPGGVCVQATGSPCPGAFNRSRTLGPIFRSLLGTQSFPLATSNFSNVGAGLYTGGNVDPSIQTIYPVPVYGTATETNKRKFNQNRFSIKADHVISGNDRLSGTFLFEDRDQVDSALGGDGTIGAPIDTLARSILAGISYIHTFSPTVVNEFRVSYLRHTQDFPSPEGLEGIPSILTAFDPLAISLGLSAGLPQFFTENQFQFQNHLSFTRGAHSFRTGAEYRRSRNGSAFESTKNGNFFPNGVEELLTDGFFGDEADLAVFGEPTFGGFALAIASIDPTTGGLPEFYRGYRNNEFAAYLQDDWKVKRNLTLNLGLRWEYYGPPHNFRKGIDSNFYFGIPVTPVPNPSPNVFFPTSSELTARVVTGSFQQRDEGIWNKDTNNFAPRVGFAWDVWGTQKLVVRGGGGVFYDRIWNNLFENIRFNAPFFSFSNVGVLGNGVPVGPLATPGLFTAPFTSTEKFATGALGVPSPRHMDQNLVTPYSEQYFLGVQYELARNTVFESNYIGTLGRKLTGVVDINTFNGRTRGGSGRRPNTAIAGDNFRTNAFKSNYHALQLNLRRRVGFGLQLDSNYTWSKAIDEISDAFNNARGLFFRPTNNFNIANDRGLADFDVRHRFVTSFNYDLPFLKRNRWLGGWSATGIITLQTGTPIILLHSGQDPNADGYFTDRPLFIGSGPVESAIRRDRSPADGYLDPSQFVGVVIAANQSGPQSVCNNGRIVSNTQWWCDSTLGRNVLSGPGFSNVDFGLHKRFAITENSGLRFQVNAFNLFNHTNFGVPDGNLASPTFGQSILTVANGSGLTAARVVQLALRYDF